MGLHKLRSLLLRAFPIVRSSLVSAKALLVSTARKVPVFGGLVDCKGADHASAAKEVFTVLVFSTITFWLSAVLIFFQSRVESGDLLTRLLGSFVPTISNGELLVFAVSLIGPIVYIAFEDPAWAKREFPQKLWHALILLVLAMMCGALFAAVKTGAGIDAERVVRASLWLACIAVLLRYLATVFSRSRSRPAEEMRHQTDEFIDRLDKHRGG